MLKACYSLASVAALGGMVFGAMAWAVGCSSSDPGATPPGGGDAGGGGTDTGPGGDKDTGVVGPGDKDSSSTSDTGPGPSVNIKYGTCPPFAKCASDPVGSYTLSGGCLSEDTFAAAKTACPGLKESNVVIKATGEVTVTALNVSRNSTTSVAASLFIPKSAECQTANVTCAQLQLGLTSGLVPNVPAFDTAACKDAAGGCDCDVAQSLTETTNDTYTSAKDGDLITSGAKGDRTFEYCVDGNKLSYLETTMNSLPFVVEMTKK